MSCLYDMMVTHHRTEPAHTLKVRIGMMLLDLDTLPSLAGGLRLFRLGRAGMVSFDARDHGDGNPAGLRNWIETRLAESGIEMVAARISILCMPRILGHGFNPLSLYVCEHADGRIGALVYEVHNTFGERHDYVQRIDTDADMIGHLQPKRFHVSPLLPMDLSYRFRTTRPGRRMALAIETLDADGTVLHAAMAGSRRTLNDFELFRLVARLPLQGLKIMLLIHWHAFRTWRKGAAFHPHQKTVAPCSRNSAVGSDAAETMSLA